MAVTFKRVDEEKEKKIESFLKSITTPKPIQEMVNVALQKVADDEAQHELGKDRFKEMVIDR